MTTSGGIAGMTGYDVQSTVILELILELDALPGSVELRPEGQDDLELRWVEPITNRSCCRYHQIKKATDNDPKAEWSLARVARELLGNAVAKLHGNQHEQVWVLGDRLADDVQQLLTAGRHAPERQRETYLIALHRLAKAEVRYTDGLGDSTIKHRLDRWNPVSHGGSVDQDVEQTLTAFISLETGIPLVTVEKYRQRTRTLHSILPDVLDRITARSYHGTERQIAGRVRKLLADRYQLDPLAVEDVIFRNLRGFINDISKEPNRTLTLAEFEEELVRVWPWLVLPTQPRLLDEDHVPRHELVQALVAPALAREAVGPSGSGKSSLASETYGALIADRPDAAVLFVEVRTRTSLRDVLVGVAYSLRRRGIGKIIESALHLRACDTDTIERVAAAFAAMTREVFLLIDCADGEVGSEFRRDLAVFTRALRGTKVHLLAFAQTSVFRELAPLDRAALEVSQEAMPGLHFGQFLTLVRRRHPDLPPSDIHDLFERLTAGLPTGILPNLAQQIARARSLAAMQEIVQRPPDQRLSTSHRDRFNSVPPGLQRAASRLVCLSIPLSASDLIALFPNDPMKAALLALVEQGLLPPFADRVEMHETVRAGLESLLSPALTKETNDTLAEYFARRDLVPARIHHLEKAGRGAEAVQLARERFLAGRDWYDLVEYVAARKCIHADEVVSLLLNGDRHEQYLLRDLLPRIQTTETASQLLESLRSEPERYCNDFQRTWLLQETLLKCDPAMLGPLVAFALEQPEREGHDVLDWLRMNARRAGIAPDASFVQWYRSLPLHSQKKVVGFLLLKPDLPRLREALSFMQQHGIAIGASRGHTLGQPILDLKTDEEIENFVEALPPAEPAKMFVARSALLEPFESDVWHKRIDLRRACRAMAKAGTAPAPVLANAIRILIFLNEREVVPLTRRYRSVDGPLAALAWMTPAILGAAEELPILQVTALAPETDLEARAMAIAMAMHLGAEPSGFLERAVTARPEQRRALETLLMLQATLVPFPGAVPLLSAALEEDLGRHRVFAGILLRLAETSFPGTRELLIKALRSPNAELVLSALMALQRSRFKAARGPIEEIVHSQKAIELRAFAIPAMLASGPNSSSLLRDVWKDLALEATHWRWVLAGRLRDVSEASALVSFATDATQDWKHRRLAILAAGRLPFPAAIELRAFAIPAMLASGPNSSSLLRDVWKDLALEATHWRWVLAGRLRDVSEASALVSFATDATQDWKHRRLAILAAGRLPFPAAMEAIAPVILRDRVLLVEESQCFQTHGLLALLLEVMAVRDLAPRFGRGRDEFVQALAPIYDDCAKDLIDKRGVLPAADAVGWLWDRLESHGFGSDTRAVDKVANDLHVPMLQAAVLLGLRRQGRRNDLFTAFKQASTNWLRIRAFNELCHGDPLSVEDEMRAQALMSTAPPLIQHALGVLFGRRPRVERPPSGHRSEEKSAPAAHLLLDYEQARAFLNSVGCVDSKAIVLDIDERQLRTLVVDLDPVRDTEWRRAPDAKPARVSLSENSWRLRGGFALEQMSPHYHQRSALRPAVAAANRFAIDIPWHRAGLKNLLSDQYANRLFASLGAQNDRDRFLQMLTDEAEHVIPLLDRPERVNQVLHLIDERALPLLDSFVQAGHGVFFEQLCRLICQVRTGGVGASLAKIFRRWLVLLDQLQSSPAHASPDTPEWRIVWQTLARLREHPHFGSIPQMQYRLLEVLTHHRQLWHGHREQILMLLREWPPAYLQFETEVFQQCNFNHYYEDKIETYDEIADSLFWRTR